MALIKPSTIKEAYFKEEPVEDVYFYTTCSNGAQYTDFDSHTIRVEDELAILKVKITGYVDFEANVTHDDLNSVSKFFIDDEQTQCVPLFKGFVSKYIRIEAKKCTINFTKFNKINLVNGTISNELINNMVENIFATKRDHERLFLTIDSYHPTAGWPEEGDQ